MRRLIFLFTTIMLLTILVGIISLTTRHDFTKLLGSNTAELNYKNAQIRFGPLPYIDLEKLYYKDIIQAKQVKMGLSLFALLRMELVPISFEIYEVVVDYLGILGDMDEILVKNIKTLENIHIQNLQIKNIVGKYNLILPNLNISQTSTEFISDITTQAQCKYKFITNKDFTDWQLTSNTELISLTKKLSNPEQSKLILNISNFDKFFSSYYQEAFDDKTVKKQNNKLIIQADLNKVANQYFIKNFSVESTIIDKIDADITIDSNSYRLQKAVITINNLIFDQFNNFENFSLTNLVPTECMFNIRDNILLNIRHIHLPLQHKIQNFMLESKNIDDNKSSLHIAAQVDDKQITIEGNILHEKFRPIFKGDIDIGNINNPISTNQISLGKNNATADILIGKAHIKASSKQFYLSDMQLSNKLGRINGDLNIKYISSIPKIALNTEIFNIDTADMFDIFGITSASAAQNIKLLKKYFYDFKRPDYLEQYNILRALPYYADLSINCKDCLIAGKNFAQGTINLEIGNNIFNVANLLIKQDETVLNAKAKLSLINIIPDLTVDIINGQLDLAEFDIIDQTGIVEYLNNNFAANKINIAITVQSLDVGFRGLLFKNISCNIHNKNNIININNFNSDLTNISSSNDNGKLSFSLNIFPESQKLEALYALNNLQCNDIMNKTFNGGAISISGSLNIDDNYTKISSRGAFVAQDFKLNNMAVDDYILNITKPANNIDNVADITTKFMNEGQTIIQMMRGKFEYKKDILSIQDTNFNTLYATGAAAASYNIYNDDIRAILQFTFYPKRAVKKNEKILPIGLLVNIEDKLNRPEKKYNISEIITFFRLEEQLNTEMDKNIIQK